LRTLESLNDKAHRPRLQPDHDPKTFGWLKKEAAFKLWLAGETGIDRTLWIHGRQGSGSSTLASWAIAFAQEPLENSGANAVILFSFDSKDDRYASTYNMLASLSHQLLCLRPELFEHVRLLFDQIVNCRNDSSYIKISYLWTLFRSLLSCPRHGETYCLIDGIDECDQSRTRFLREFLQLPNSTNSTFRLVVSSATERGQHAKAPSANRIDLDAVTERKKHIEIILQSNISSLMKRKPQYRKAAAQISQILRDSSGTLSEAMITLTLLDELDIRSTQAAVEEVMKSSSETVPNLFQRFLEENDERTSNWAIRALSWIINTKRPLSLSELSVVVAIKYDKEKDTFLYFEDEVLMDPKSDLQRLFSGLIKIRNEEVLFAHKGFEKFLKANHRLHCKGTSGECPLCSNWHSSIARSCLSYLSMLSAPHSQESPREDISAGLSGLNLGHATLPIDSLQAYAVQYWPSHYQSGEINQAELEQFKSLFKNDDLVTMWSRLFQTYQNPSANGNVRDPLSVAAEVGCGALVDILLEKSIGDKSKALESAIESGQESLIDSLLKSCAVQPRVISIASAHARDKIASKLIEKNYSINVPDKFGMVSLHIASECGSLAIVSTLLNKDSSPTVVDARNSEGLTALHLASMFGHTDVIRSLLENNSKIGAVSNDGSTPIHFACKWQQPGAVEILLKSGAKIDEVDDSKVTPLHLAAACGRVDMVKMLLGYIPDSTNRDELIKSRDASGYTALHSAAATGHIEVVEELLAQTTEPDVVTTITDGQSRVPLHCASKSGHFDIAVALLAVGNDQLGLTDYSLSNPIHLAVGCGDDRIVRLLCLGHIRENKSLDVFNSSKLTPLHIACDAGNANMVRFLLTAGAAAEISGENNETPLHLACRNGFWEISELLMAFNANPMAKTSDGYSPLHLASEGGHLNVVKKLIEAVEESVNVADNSGRTPIHLAAQGGHDDVVKWLEGAGADLEVKDETESSLLHFACKGGSVEIVKRLLDMEGLFVGSVDDVNELDQLPLHIAAEADRLGVVKQLIASDNASANATAIDRNGQTPLELASDVLVIEELWDLTVGIFDSPKLIQLIHMAASQGHKKVLERLLNMGNIPNVDHDNEKTALMLAAQHGHLDIVQLLLKPHGEMLVTKDKYGRTPLSYAAENGYAEVVLELLQIQQDKDSLDKLGRTPLSYASENGHNSIIEHLMKSGASIHLTANDIPTPIWYAAKGGHSSSIKVLLQHDADPNIVGHEGQTVLHLAANMDYWETATIILESPVFTMGNLQDEKGSTAMYIAAYHGNVKTISVLLTAGLDKEIPGPKNWRPIHAACDSLPITRLLLNAKAKVDTINDDGLTALSLAICGRGECEDIATALLQSGADPLIADGDGDTTLHLAAVVGSSIKLSQLLLERAGSLDGFNINARNKEGRSPLWRAIANGNTELTKALLQRNDTNIHELDSENHSPLWGGIDKAQLETVKLLLQRMDETQWKALSAAGETPEALLLHASRQDNEEIIDVVMESVSGITDGTDDALFKLAMDDDPKLATFLLRNNADPLKTDEHGWTLGWLAFSLQNKNEDSGGIKLQELPDMQFNFPTSLHEENKNEDSGSIKLQELPDMEFNFPTSWSEENKTENIILDVDPDSDSTEKVMVDSDLPKGTCVFLTPKSILRDQFNLTVALELERSNSGITQSRQTVRRRNPYRREGVRANHPVPPNGIFYFEIEVLRQTPGR
jgi:ankyrin repeat protein